MALAHSCNIGGQVLEGCCSVFLEVAGGACKPLPSGWNLPHKATTGLITFRPPTGSDVPFGSWLSLLVVGILPRLSQIPMNGVRTKLSKQSRSKRLE